MTLFQFFNSVWCKCLKCTGAKPAATKSDLFPDLQLATEDVARALGTTKSGQPILPLRDGKTNWMAFHPVTALAMAQLGGHVSQEQAADLIALARLQPTPQKALKTLLDALVIELARDRAAQQSPQLAKPIAVELCPVWVAREAVLMRTARRLKPSLN